MQLDRKQFDSYFTAENGDFSKVFFGGLVASGIDLLYSTFRVIILFVSPVI